ncbi:hypothetical protein ATO6_07240 [Oceanicola sp. 22II-s10i]|uniref:hypothetical protein n=1 Tax=Oceanicola sp. 22II-s10i TaxID=1317116 RepID=UPI000B5248BC|nr:hypothetical protein [Oceanicola sp. 22II-s10i]OWU86572.1 hypothetical protein ATO6_07240 [Oceanicola sp. 22II-s10i]
MPFYDHIILIRLGLGRWRTGPARRRLTTPLRLRAAPKCRPARPRHTVLQALTCALNTRR